MSNATDNKFNESNDVDRNVLSVTDEGVYWLDSIEDINDTTKQVLLFGQNDIFTNKPPRSHINKLLTKKYGARSSKLNDSTYYNTIFERHENVRQYFQKNVRASVEEIMTSIAIKIGMRDGKARFTFIDIARHVLERPSWESFCRLNFVLRGAYEQHYNWKINFETTFMKKLNYKYLNDFRSEGKQHGCFVRILSDVFSNKIRDVNSRLKKHLGVSLTIRTQEHKDSVQRRMNPNNKAFFGITKNIKIHSNSDAYQRICNDTKITINYDFPPPPDLLMHLNKNGEIEYNILEGIVFPIGSLISVRQTLTCWISDLPMNGSEQNKINNRILDQNKNNVETNTDDNVLNKKQIIRRMAGTKVLKKVRMCIIIFTIFLFCFMFFRTILTYNCFVFLYKKFTEQKCGKYNCQRT